MLYGTDVELQIGLKIRSRVTPRDSLRMFPKDMMQISKTTMPGIMLDAELTDKNGTWSLPSGRKSI